MKRCLNALEELGTLQVTSHILQKNTDVVATLKKVQLEPRGGRGQGQVGPSRWRSAREPGVPGHSCFWSVGRKPADWLSSASCQERC